MTDGRVARRERNVEAVLDAVLEMFAEDSLFPTIEQAASRSGLSLRSLYRYFADPGELLEAAIKRSFEIGVEVAHLPSIGKGPFDQRVDDFVAMRMRVSDAAGPMFRATVANAARVAPVAVELARVRDLFRDQFERQFAPELAARTSEERDHAASAGDLLTQIDSIDYLRRHRGLTNGEAAAVLRSSLFALLG